MQRAVSCQNRRQCVTCSTSASSSSPARAASANRPSRSRSALAAARQGKRTIVCEVSSQEHASRVLHRAEVGFHEVEIADNLWAMSIDPDESMKEYVLLQLKVKAMRDMLFRSKIFNYLAAATPGLRELVTIGKIWELAHRTARSRRGRATTSSSSTPRPPGTGSASCRRRGRSPRSLGSARSARRRRRSTPSSATTARPVSRSSPCPRRCRSTNRRCSRTSSATRSASRSTAST